MVVNTYRNRIWFDSVIYFEIKGIQDTHKRQSFSVLLLSDLYQDERKIFIGYQQKLLKIFMGNWSAAPFAWSTFSVSSK